MSTSASPDRHQVNQAGDRVLPLLTPAEAAALLRRSPATLANWRAAGTGPPYEKVGRLVHYRQTEVEHWLSDKARHQTREPVQVVEPIRPPLTAAELLEVVMALAQLPGSDAEGDMLHGLIVQLALIEEHLEARSQVTVMPLLGIALHELPDHQRVLTLYGQHPDAAGQSMVTGSRSLRPSDRTLLLTVLNTPSEREYAPARELVDAFLAHGQTPHLVKLFNASFRAPALPITLKLRHDLDLQDLPVFTPTGGALHQWMTAKDPWRLKRCVECQHYFFDATKNGRKLHCSERCSTRHGSRTYRARLAG